MPDQEFTHGETENVNIHRLTCCCLTFLAITSFTHADDQADRLANKYPVLARLTPPKKELPANCKAPELPDNVPRFEGLKNRSITVDPKFFLIGDERLEDLLDSKAIKATYYAIYRERHACGIIGWAFATDDDAKKAHNALAASYANEKSRFRLWHTGKYVVWLWRDPGTSDKCFQFFEQYVNSQLKTSVQSSPKKQPNNEDLR